ncbi:unnamed protein product [Phytophthora fragariaefolia]|uniref:Unnamed protein product n=1 Tax=Phytophthora fragariaefolia TaxID=1490495 RepID=A0A9W7D208_9STRA|nr:unnamed protein product [Phytophthora fragariaefolia]
MRSGGTCGDSSSTTLITPRLDSIAERSVSFDDDSMTGSDAKDDEDLNEGNYDLEEKAPAPMAVTPDTPEDAVMFAGRSGGVRPLSRNLVDEFNEDDGPEPAYEDFEDDGDNSKSPIVTTQVTEQATGNRTPLNGDTPSSNKVLGKSYEDIKSSDWGELFEPTMIRQTVWSELSNELAWPVNSTTIEQVAKDTVAFYRPWAKRDRWKKRLRSTFGMTKFSSRRQKNSSSAGVVTDPALVPLPQPPNKIERGNLKPTTTGEVFSTTAGRSPYFQDSHMVTPSSAKHQGRNDRAAGNSKATENTRRGTGKSIRRRYQPEDDSSCDDEGYDGDGGVQMDEYMRQIRELTESEQLNATPRIEVATHRPLGQIKPLSGRRNKSENSMQWLRSFIYEMKGTRAPPNEWCMPFELSLRDGALHWYRQLPKKTKQQWSALSEAFIKYYCTQFNQSAESRYYSARREGKEHVCDYLNRLNGYARNAGIQFDNGDRKARDHVRRFLETCGDRAPATTRTNTLRVAITHADGKTDATTTREITITRRTDETDTMIDAATTRNTPKLSLAEASIADMLAELHCRDCRTTLNEFASARGSDRSDRSSDTGSERGSDDSGRSYEEWGNELSQDESGRYLAAANESERRAAAEDGEEGLESQTPVSTLQRLFKLGSPPTETGLAPIGLPQLTAPAIEAECIFAFVGKCELPNDGGDISVNTTEKEQERGTCLDGGERNKETQVEVKEEGPDNWTLSARQEEKPHRELAKEVQLLPGERLEWWSEQKFDRRVRMRTLEILGHGRCMEGQGITKGKTTTTRRASVKITFGWERVYVFELWIMDHNAGIDVVLGTDFMIPAGVRLDLFQANAKLPDEVMIPLIKTMSMLDEPEVVAYEAVRDKTLFRRERELYEEWLAAQPPAVDRPSYTRPKQILRRYLDNSDSDSGGAIADEEAEDSSWDEDPAGSHEVHEGTVSVAISGPPTAGEIKTAHSGNATSKARGTVHEAVVSEAMTNSEPPGCSPGVPTAVATTI